MAAHHTTPIPLPPPHLAWLGKCLCKLIKCNVACRSIQHLLGHTGCSTSATAQEPGTPSRVTTEGSLTAAQQAANCCRVTVNISCFGGGLQCKLGASGLAKSNTQQIVLGTEGMTLPLHQSRRVQTIAAAVKTLWDACGVQQRQLLELGREACWLASLYRTAKLSKLNFKWHYSC